MATPSSKPNPGATPTYLTSSPRPAGAHPARPIAHKSPAGRTPSISGPGGHIQPPATTNSSSNNPTSAHHYATPLAATTGADDPVTLSSPSALLALGGYSGISPSPAGNDGLVGAGMNDNDIQALGMQGLKLGGGGGGARDNDEERKRHIEDVVQLLRTRIAGRGVCREGIERLGQLEGFESIWQEDSLSIAGNFVDLEIEFHRGHNVVKDVSLTYVTPESTDGGERREEATAVLKRDLIQSPEDGERGSWKPLTGFHENLQWLARHDRLSQEVNCFEAIEGLYESLKRVWDAEWDRRKFLGVYDHLCSGWVGRPCLHKGGRVGLSLDYWVQQARVLDAKQARQKQVSADEMAVDQPAEQEEAGRKGKWSVVIECEEGYPSLRVSKDWVASEVLTSINSGGDGPSSSESVGSQEVVVNWAEPPETSISATQGDSDAMALDSGMLGSSAPNRRFVARMEPPLDLPILAASDIYRHLGMQMPQEFKMVTYDGLLAPGWSPLSAAGAMGLGPEEASQLGRRSRRMSLQTIDKDGNPCTKQHCYTFQPFESVAGRTMRDFPFSHPRQLADILPILRQYAFLANLIRSIFTTTSKPDNDKLHAQEDLSRGLFNPSNFNRSQMSRKGDIIILSNDDPNEKKLNSLLGGLGRGGAHTAGKGKGPTDGSSDEDSTTEDDVKIDVTLRTQLGQAPVIMLLFTVDHSDGESVRDQELHALSKVSVSLEVGLNGRVAIIDMTGLLDDENDKADKADTQAADSSGNELLELQKTIARVLEVSQDLGILVEWVVRWARQRKSR